MNANRLSALYDRVADAPDAVNRLRRFMLDLAVRGKLVEQDPADEAASELLKRIMTKRAQLAEARVIRKPKPMERLDEPPFAIPPSWKWTRLGELAELVRGVSFPASAKSNEPADGLLPCLRSGNIQTSTVWDDLIYVPESVVKSAEKLVKSGDVLISIANSYALVGKCSIVCAMPYRATFGAFLAAIRFHFVLPEYAKSFLKSDFSSSAFRVGSSQTTNIANITFSTIRGHPFPLPPLAEQRRIVAKVDQLMALCDRMEETRAARADTRDRLTKASLARLTASDTDAAAFRGHARFAIHVLPALTARADQIPDLRQAILNLAVRGKLVEQDPADEPASALLTRIAAERARMVKAGTLRRRKPASRLDEPPFSLPENWFWARIREVASDRGHKVPDRPFTYIDVSAIDKKAGLISEPKVLDPDNAPSRARKVARQGDVVYSCVRPYLLNVAIIECDFDPPPIASTAFEVLNGHGLVLPRYTWMVLRSSFMIACVEKSQRGQAYPAINSTDFAVLPFPLPPLAEQRRIVAKVDELMGLFDRLEAGLDATDGTRNRLLVSLLQDTLAPSVYDATPGRLGHDPRSGAP